MRGSEPRMNTAIRFVERLDGFPAQGQEFFILNPAIDGCQDRESVMTSG